MLTDLRRPCDASFFREGNIAAGAAVGAIRLVEDVAGVPRGVVGGGSIERKLMIRTGS